jgi:hypothetical protein
MVFADHAHAPERQFSREERTVSKEKYRKFREGTRIIIMIIIIIIIIILHYSICKTSGIETTENWYSHIPKPVCQHEDITVLWNQGIQTDREVLANRPDIIIKNMKDKICLLIDVGIPSDRNVIQKSPKRN